MIARSRYPWLAPAVVTGALSPLLMLGVRAVRGTLPANGVEYVLNQLGLLALVCLFASLACTPLRLIFQWSWPLALRRVFGLLAFAYASMHAFFYLGVDQGWAWGTVLEDVLERPFIALGALAWLVLVPLALTSTAKSIKRLGAKRWRRIHKLAYVASTLALVHFFLRVKIDLTEPLLYGAVLGSLFGVRLVYRFRGRRRANALPSNG